MFSTDYPHPEGGRRPFEIFEEAMSGFDDDPRTVLLAQRRRALRPRLTHPVAEVDGAAAEPVLVDELEIGACAGRQCGVAPTEDDWPDEQDQLVDQPGGESLRCEVRATDQ